MGNRFTLLLLLSAAASGGWAQTPQLDEATVLNNDYGTLRQFRYVFGYNKDRERSSETVYVKERENGVWGNETLLDVGRYIYEYDSQQRIKMKTVRYDNGTTGWLTSYRIEAEYGQDGITEYTRYEDGANNGEYGATGAWAYHPNGVLAMKVDIPWAGEAPRNIFKYNDKGDVCFVQPNSYDAVKMTANSDGDSLVTVMSSWDGSTWNVTSQRRVKYDSRGHVVEFVVWNNDGNSYYDYDKYLFTYDDFGRIARMRKYEFVNNGGDDVDPGIPTEQKTPNKSIVAPYLANATEIAEPTDDASWSLDYDETYTYFNNDVYTYGNSWHDVFRMDGPLVSVHLVDDGYVSDITFNRDATGKLLSVAFQEETVDGVTNINEATVNANGEITYLRNYFKEEYEGQVFEDETNTTYIWQDGKMVKEQGTCTATYNTGYTFTRLYTYGAGSVTIEDVEDGVTRKIVKTGNRIMRTKSDSYSNTNREVTDMQTYDVSFVRKSPLKDINGFTPEETVVLSRKGRGVGASSGTYGNYDKQLEMSEIDESYVYFNLNPDSYFFIEPAGDTYKAYNIDNRLQYVVAGGLLLKEYVYYEEVSSTGGGSVQALSSVSETTDGCAYDEISYYYTREGVLLSQTVTSYDEDGNKEDEVKLDYNYTGVDGINSISVDGKSQLRLNGRMLGLGGNGQFSVYALDGTLLQSGTSSYTFSRAGIYIVKCGSRAVKVQIR